MPEWIAPSLAHFGIDGEDAEPPPLPYVVVATGRPVTTMPELSQVDQAAELPEPAGLGETAGRPGARGGFVRSVDHT